MGRESIFQGALSNFIFEFTCGGAIRHLADQGFTSKQIMGRLSFPLPYERVRQAVTDYYLEKGVLLRGEPARGGKAERYVYVQDHGKYGKTSFRRVPVENPPGAADTKGALPQVPWTERTLTCRELADELRKCSLQAGQGKIYAACSFGAAGTGFEGVQALNERQREYLQGICWDRQTMYHLMNPRMSEIVIRLCEGNFWQGRIYREDVREILIPEENTAPEEHKEKKHGSV